MSPLLLLVHGWGFDAAFWNPLQAALTDIDSIAWDLGFCGQPAAPALPTDRPIIAVGHSLGFLWLLQERPCRWDKLVAINGFPRFTKSDDFPAGVPPRLLERMIGKLAGAPAAVTQDFLLRCGLDPALYPIDDTALDADRLAWGLNGLAHWDQRQNCRADLVLAGRNDPIVPAAMTEAAFAPSPVEWQDGGHLLPLTAPDWCAAHLRGLLESR